MTADTFRVAVTSAAAVRRPAQIVHRLGPGADHPVALAHPEGDYLKGLVVRLRDAGELVGIRVLDHVIVAASGYASLVEPGVL